MNTCDTTYRQPLFVWEIERIHESGMKKYSRKNWTYHPYKVFWVELGVIWEGQKESGSDGMHQSVHNMYARALLPFELIGHCVIWLSELIGACPIFCQSFTGKIKKSVVQVKYKKRFLYIVGWSRGVNDVNVCRLSELLEIVFFCLVIYPLFIEAWKKKVSENKQLDQKIWTQKLDPPRRSLHWSPNQSHR